MHSGNPWLETELWRNDWGGGNGSDGGSYIVSDCGAVKHFVDKHFNASAEEAVAQAMNSGTDITCNEFGIGGGYLGDVATAIGKGLTSTAALDATIKRSAMLHFRAGLFESTPDAGPFGSLSVDVVGSPAHHKLALEAARQSLVLLKNEQQTLPFAKGKHVAVVGVVGNSSDFISGNYYSSICPGGTSDFSCVPTLYTAVHQQNTGGMTTFSPGGSSVKAPADSGAIAAAVASATAADQVIVAVGIDKTVCGEGKDRSDIGLPPGQLQLLAAILQLKKPTCVVLFNGGQLAVPLAKQDASAVMEAYFPGESGGTAVAEAIFGVTNTFGKLAYSIYNTSMVDDFELHSQDMSKLPGRGYRYYTPGAISPISGKPADPLLWEFGTGLSYTTFSLKWAGLPPHQHAVRTLTDAATNYTATVTNTGTIAGDEVVIVYLKPKAETLRESLGESTPIEKKKVIDFARVSLAAGATTTVSFAIAPAHLAMVDSDGHRSLHHGDFELLLSRGSNVNELTAPVQVRPLGAQRMETFRRWW